MSMTRNLYGLALVALAGTAVSAEPTAKDARSTTFTAEQTAPLTHNLQHSGPVTQGDYDHVFDNMTDADSVTGFNVAYTDPGSYDGSSTSTFAYLSPMGSQGTFFDAPAHPDSGIPTDIWYDEFAADLAIWGAPGTMHAMTGLDFIPVICPNGWTVTPPATIDWVMVYGVINFDGDTWFGGVQVTWPSVSAGFCGWFAVDDADNPGVVPGIDMLGGGLEFDIEDIGWLLVDWRQDQMINDEGSGHMIAGGDLLDTNYPAPDEQWTLGETDFTLWIASDGVTGVDPGADGDPADTSYVDVILGASNINWAFVDNVNTPTSELAHDFPFRVYAQIGGGPDCVGDLNGDNKTDQQDLGILLASFEVDDGGDLNGDGNTDQQDLGILLADWNCGV